jgi:8-oxo-dGTP diphosphatase
MSTIIDKLAWIYLLDKHILITRSKGKDTYYIPGGKREESETDHEALLREVREELTVELLPETIKFFGRFEAQAHGKAQSVLVQMTCYTAEFTGEIHAASEIEEVAWFNYSDKGKTSAVDHIIFDFLKENDLLG